MNVPTQGQVQESLQSVLDPELQKSMVELGMVKSIAVSAEGRVDVLVALDTPGCAPRAHFERAVKQRVMQMEGVRHVNVHLQEPKPKPSRAPAQQPAAP